MSHHGSVERVRVVCSVLLVVFALSPVLTACGGESEDPLTTDARDGLIQATKDLMAISNYFTSEQFNPLTAEGHQELQEMERQLSLIHAQVLADREYFTQLVPKEPERRLAAAATEHAAAAWDVVGALADGKLLSKKKFNRMADTYGPLYDELESFMQTYQQE